MSQERASSYSRRSALVKTVQFAAFVGASWAAGARADSLNKVPQRAAGYQANPADGKKCESCAQFRAPDGCGLVQGPISPDGWCRLFRPKDA